MNTSEIFDTIRDEVDDLGCPAFLSNTLLKPLGLSLCVSPNWRDIWCLKNTDGYYVDAVFRNGEAQSIYTSPTFFAASIAAYVKCFKIRVPASVHNLLIDNPYFGCTSLDEMLIAKDLIA